MINANTVSQKEHSPSSQTVKKTITIGLLLSSATCATGIAHAQDGATLLERITVVGTRTEVSVQDNPASVTVVDEEQLEREAPESIAEMLRDVPGVEVVDASAAGMKRIRIRGESSARVTILVDGQEITDHSTYGTPILIDPANVERIDVVRGPASVLYGARAIGGVVNIITKGGADKPVQVELGGTYYSGSKGWQGWAAVSGTVGDFDYRLSGGLDDHGDRKVPEGQYTSTGYLDGTSFSNDNLYLHLGYAFGEDRNHYVALKAEQHRLEAESWTDPSYLEYPITDFRVDLPQRDRRKIGLYYDGKDLGPVLRNVHLDVYYQTVDRLFENQVVMAPLPGRTVDVTSTSDDRITNWGGTAQLDLEFHPDHYTIVGLNYLADNLVTDKTSTTVTTGFGPFPIITSSLSADDASIHTLSAFAQNEWSFAEDFKLTTGLRYYHIETDLNDTTDPARADYEGRSDDRAVVAAGLTYTGLPDTTLRALYSEGYVTPTLLQLFTNTTAGRGVLTYGNPDLEPETSRNFEAGARYDAYGIVLDAAAFYTEAKNYVTTVPCTAGAGCPGGATAADYLYKNADAATTYGVELLAEYAAPNTSLTPYVSGAWMRRELQFPTYSTYNSNTPELSGRAGVKYEGEVQGINIWADLFVRAATGTKLTSLNADTSRLETERLPGWGTLNFAFGGSFGEDDRVQFAVHLNNLTNKEYRSSFDELPGTGRSIEATLKMMF
ncbi:TonB-dependent receptor [Chelativorans sp. AA-79]|uniref:TonB-dependent receptor plug domain-containing protein n=1 Tax=Chelativorans sp. AA-79 TaxID=3028735 RepID=UPI0023F7902D|nr:TonB-dependent receptor [Chelativorans sp. AA-79]WEX08555.1 TonB-dependent receptor [Chelativorans sp. AA-79]